MWTFLGAMVWAVTIQPVSAVSITADVRYDVVHNTNGAESDRVGPTTSSSGYLDNEISYLAASPGSSGVFSRIVAGSIADESGWLAGGGLMEFNDDVTTMSFQSVSSWSDTITNTTGGAATFDFDFLVTDGYLYVQDAGMAKFQLEVLVDGASIWSSTASLELDGLGNPALIETDGHASIITDYGSIVSVEFEEFSGNILLGSLAHGESLDLTYRLSVMGSLTQEYSFVNARVGAPNSAGFSGTVNSTPVSAPVPEPTTMALLGMGIAGLGARRLRKKN